jgi:hypothetical protein
MVRIAARPRRLHHHQRCHQWHRTGRSRHSCACRQTQIGHQCEYRQNALYQRPLGRVSRALFQPGWIPVAFQADCQVGLQLDIIDLPPRPENRLATSSTAALSRGSSSIQTNMKIRPGSLLEATALNILVLKKRIESRKFFAVEREQMQQQSIVIWLCRSLRPVAFANSWPNGHLSDGRRSK